MSEGVTSSEVASNQNVHKTAETNLMKEQNMIKSHPLFALLALAFEKCELATCTTRFNGVDVCSSQSFADDVQDFASKLKHRSSVFTSNQDIDSLMIQAIQVLRIHLLELEKVHHLCNNFCKRYISTLEGKMPLDLVLEEESEGRKQTLNNPEKTTSSDCQILKENPVPNMNASSLEGFPATSHNRESNIQSYNQTSCAFLRRSDHEGCSPASSETNADSSESFMGQDDDDMERPKQKKRGIFPKMATNIMKAWLFQHLAHPYPSEDQKRILANDTGLTILQVNNWFINARRRIVQPMIDASSRSGKTPVITVFKSRKRKITSPQNLLQNNSHYPNAPSYYQQPSIYNQDYCYPSHHSTYYADTNANSNQFVNNSHSSCQYQSGFPIDVSTCATSLPSCMQARQQVYQSQYDTHSNNHNHNTVSQLFSYPVYSSDNQLQNDQFYVKAT